MTNDKLSKAVESILGVVIAAVAAVICIAIDELTKEEHQDD